MNRLKKYILVVEDEKDIADFIGDEFIDEGFQIVKADNLKDAIFKSNNQDFALIILDIKLKNGTGDDLIKHIKNNNRHINYETPIVVTSGWLTKEIIDNVGKGINYAFVKPFDIESVIKKCLELIEKREAST